ncbi:MAG TPA: SPOR domain-containing protein, partial [Novosphingobium sp.]|nr:SPOR domain-containing protein [Novosphingobium sp.]
AAAPDDLRRAEAAPAVPAYRPPVFHPVVAEAAPAPRVLAHGMAPARAAVPHGARKPASAGSHVVQLGAFASAENAEKARRQFMAHGAFAGHSIEVARAEVNGRAFWRVSARGYDAASAQGACGALKRHGAVCLARADLGGAQHAAALHGHGTPDLAFADRR